MGYRVFCLVLEPLDVFLNDPSALSYYIFTDAPKDMITLGIPRRGKALPGTWLLNEQHNYADNI